jgi:hypothetical protein
MHEIQQSGWLTPYLVLIAAWPSGLMLLLYTAVKERIFPAAPIAIFSVGILAVGLQGTVIHDRDYYVASSSVLVLTTIVLVVWLGRTMREEDGRAPVGGPAVATRG